MSGHTQTEDRVFAEGSRDTALILEERYGGPRSGASVSIECWNDSLETDVPEMLIGNGMCDGSHLAGRVVGDGSFQLPEIGPPIHPTEVSSLIQLTFAA